mgnify:CR=1 FL=1
MSKVQDWKTIEMLGYSYYSSKGYNILISLVEGPSFDFVAEKNNEYLKVNVKVSGLKSKASKNSWSISVSSGPSIRHRNTLDVLASKGHVDRYLVWLPHKNTFIELPGNFFEGARSKSKQIPKDLMAASKPIHEEIGINAM